MQKRRPGTLLFLPICPHIVEMFSVPKLRKSLILSITFAGLLWSIKLWEWLSASPLASFGVFPQDPQGLAGILFAPLIHGSFSHIATNTLGVVVLGTALLYGYPKSRWWVLAMIWILSGIGVWLFARPSLHIGASGLTHGLFFFLFVVSVLRRDKRSIALMMLASLLFGGMFWGVLPSQESISFEYHFFGGAAGALAALLFWRWDPKPKQKRYAWEDEVVDEPFDESELPSDSSEIRK